MRLPAAHQVEAFFVPAGTVVEMYGTTLHYAPCNDGEEGFKCIVILPKGTNTEIDFALPKSGEDALMTAKNKWLIAHEEARIRGATLDFWGSILRCKKDTGKTEQEGFYF